MKRPNILWYCTDQQRFDTIASLNNKTIQTPNIDRLAVSGTSFTHAFVQSTVCTPSRASFLTGMYPSALAVNQNGAPTFPPHFANRLIPHHLADKGYRCGLVGKLHIASATGGQEVRVDDGYDFFEYSHDHKGPKLPGNDYARWLREVGRDPVEILEPPIASETYQQGANASSFGGLSEPTKHQDNIPAEVHQTRWCTEKALEFLEQSKDQDDPWLLSVNPFDPHPPYDPPWEYFRRLNAEEMIGPHYVKHDLDHQKKLEEASIDFQSKAREISKSEGKRIQAAYYAMIEQLDFEFGRLLDWLDQNDLTKNTIIIFMSDHGEMLGDHGLILKGCRLYEGLVRVPLIISCPAMYQQNTVSDELVEMIDIVPTLYEGIGLEIPYYIQGQSLHSLLTGKRKSHKEAVRTESYGTIAYPDQTHATMYRDKRWKLISYHGKNLHELYDLESDPWEHHDLSGDPSHKDKLNELIIRSFDATVFSHAPDLPRVAPY